MNEACRITRGKLILYRDARIKALTREIRARPKPLRYGSMYDNRRRIAEYWAWLETVTTLAPDRLTTRMIIFQNGQCYLCQGYFGRDMIPTKDHVTPRKLGGRNEDNILMACGPCNVAKGHRPPTYRELELLKAFNTDDQARWAIVIRWKEPLTGSSEKPARKHAPPSKRFGYRLPR